LNHEQRLIRVICDNLGVEPAEVKPTARFVEDLRADSLDVIVIVMALEDEFTIAITDDEGAKIVTVQDAANLIDRLVAAQAAPAQ